MSRRRVGLREHRVEVRDPCVRDEALRAVEDVFVALTLRLRAHRGGIGAGAGLGQRVGGDPLAARDLRQETVLLLLGARKPKSERAQLLHGEDEPYRRIGLGDLLHRDEQHQRARVRPSVTLVEGEPEDLVLAQKLDHVPREVARLVDLGRAGSDSLPRQGADELADLTLLLGKRVPRHIPILGVVGIFEPRVQMVVVIPKNLHDARWAREPRVRADEDERGARGDEAVDEILSEPVLDLARDERRPLAPVPPRVVDVYIEPVLVRRVAGPEGASPRAAEVADSEARRRRMRLSVPRGDAKDLADEEVRPPPPAGPVGAPMEQRIPREEASAGRRELHAAYEASRRRRP